jgi:hypothetical protein
MTNETRGYMKGSKIFAVFRLIMVCSLFFMIASCVQSHLENKLNIKKARIQETFDSCKGKLTKKDLAMKASAPAERVPVDDGEIWIYKYRGTRGNTRDGHPINMEVRVHFDKKGIMNNFTATGHLGEFETPFEDLQCESIQPAVPNSGSASVPGNLTGGYLGVKVQSVTEDMAQASGLHKHMGAFVLLVAKNSPAQQAGIKSGDIILAFDGKEINDWRELTPAVQATPAGKTADVRIIRDGQELTVKVKIGVLSNALQNSGNAPVPALPAGGYQGSRNYENGDKYAGDFVQGRFNGKGIYTYANGNKYEGEFVNGKFTGAGIFTCSNGRQYKGNLEGKEPLGLTVTCD